MPSPNIWHHPRTYEIENLALDPQGRIDAAIRELTDWSGHTVLDLGCGTGFHLPRWAREAREVVGVEPHRDLARLAARRTRRLGNVEVRTGTAQDLPVAENGVDLVHARWADFFGPGCEPGLAELARVVRPGGTAVVLDTDAARSTYGRWFAQGNPSVDPVAVERFWSTQGWGRRALDVVMHFEARTDLEAVLRIELPPEVADAAVREHRGLEIDHAVNLWWRRY